MTTERTYETVQTPTPQPDVITILEPSLRYGFTQLPRPVLKAKALSRNAKTLYALLLDYAWQSGSCFPGQARLAADLDISVDSVRRDLEELRRYGLISWQRRPGLAATNLYFIHRLTDCAGLNLPAADMPSLHAVDMPPAHAAAVPSTQTASMPHKHDPSVNKTQTKETQQPAQTRSRVVALVPKQTEPVLEPEESNLLPEVADLVAFGWQPAKAIALVERFGVERVSRHIEGLRFLQRRRPDLVRDPAAWLRRAIEEDWPTRCTADTPAPPNAFTATSDPASVCLAAPPDPALTAFWQTLVPRLRPALNMAKATWLASAVLTTDDPAIRACIADGTPLPDGHQPKLCLTLNRRWQRAELSQTDLYYIEMLLNDRLGVPVRLTLNA